LWSSSDLMYFSSSPKSSLMVCGSSLDRCEAAGPGVSPVISAQIVVLLSAPGV
jgi:hypothetical protein